ncbi:MAG: TetR/AcrR family transcriptional regulator [Thermoleophilaceae bacterium]
MAVVGVHDTSERADSRRNREAVLEAAIRLLAERPGASMREVAEASGLGRTTVYRHFPQREDLVQGLFHRVVEESRATSARLVGEGVDAAELLRRLGRECVAIGDRFRFLQTHRGMRNDTLEQSQDTAGDPLYEFFEAARSRGELYPGTSTEWILVMLRATIVAAVDEVFAGRMEIEEAGELVGQTLVRAIVAD